MNANRDSTNPIIRRLMRHTSVATVLTPPSATGKDLTAPQESSETISDAESPSAVMMARLLSGPTLLRTGYVIGTLVEPPVAPEPLRQHVFQAPSPTRPIQARPAPPTISPPALKAEVKNQSETDDPTWRRLEAIYHKHQEKKGSELASSSAEELEDKTSAAGAPAAPMQRKPIAASSDPDVDWLPQDNEEVREPQNQDITPSRPAPAPSEGASVIQRSLGEETWSTPVIPSPTQQSELRSEATIQTGPKTDADVHDQADLPDQPFAPEEPEVPVVEDETTTEVRAVQPDHGSEPLGKADVANSVKAMKVQRSPAEKPPADDASPLQIEKSKPTASKPPLTDREESKPEKTDLVQMTSESFETLHYQLISDFASSDEVVAPNPTVEESSSNETTLPDGEKSAEGDAPIQPLPLEAVWPVQRLEAPVFPIASGLPTETTISDEVSPEPTFAELPTEPSVERVLRHRAVDQQTDSSIEIIGPRRPRPVERSPETKSIQRVPDEPAEKPPTTTRTKRPISEEDQVHPRAADIVETDIGPLPADLWDLIGQSLPENRSQTPAQAKAPSSDARSVNLTPPVTPAEPGPTTSSQAKKGVPGSRDEPPKIIQRQTADEATVGGVQAESVPAGAVKETQAEESLSEMLDTDELARRVYCEVKRRLSIEKERTRGL